MCCARMNTSAVPTSEDRDSDSGWRLGDDLWVAWMAGARAAWLDDDPAHAAACCSEAGAMAAGFEPDDPRRAATSHALALMAPGPEGAEAGLTAALEAWRSAGPWVERMSLGVRARSSLFHMRLESKHRGVYPDIARQRCRRMLHAGMALIEAERAACCGDRHAMEAAMACRRDAFGHRESAAAAMAHWLGEPVRGREIDRFAEHPPMVRDDEARLYAAALLVPLTLDADQGRHLNAAMRGALRA